MVGGVEVGGGGLDAAGCGAGLLALIGREGRQLCLRFALVSASTALREREPELGGALTLRLEARFVGLAAALVAGGAFARGLLFLGLFRWQGGGFFPDARVDG